MSRAEITLYYKNEKKAAYILDASNGSLSVGRNPACDIHVNDASVSGQHGRFYREGGAVYYADLNSTNGSRVDGKQLASGSAILHNGSVVALSGSESNNNISFKIALPEAAGKTPSAIAPGETFSVGRDPSCRIVLTQINASRFHATVETRGDGVYITDNNSTNGTFVNGARITKPRKISGGDFIHIAGTRFRLENGTLVPDGDQHGLPVYVHGLSRRVMEKGREKLLLDDINLTLEPNEFVAIMGGSGAGKSTLMNVLCGKTVSYEGNVAYDRSGADSRGAYKSVVGFAPQHDVLYDDLTLQQLLYYSAKLKMPGDARPEEYERRISEAMQKVQLEGHENTLIGKLSGGQRKRASIAIELLSNPRLFFLDEPTSGLDPSTERELMRMLKKMAADKKTIVAVTHITQNISLCDKLIILGRGGKLCFFGTPDDACAFFEVTDFVDIYDKVNTNPDEWKQKYIAKCGGAYDTVKTADNSNSGPKPRFTTSKSNSSNNSGLRQFAILTSRYLRLITSDTKRLLLLLLQAPVLGILLMLVSSGSADDGVFAYSSTAKSMLFSLTCAAFWVGMLNSIQEICKERAIYERERMSAVRTLPYVFSKLTVIGLLSVFQSLTLILAVRLFTGALPENSFGVPAFAGFLLTTCLTTICAACLGLAISALSPNPDRAMAIAPLVLLPQILFSGVVFELTGFMNFISNIITCKLSMQNYGVLTDFNSLPSSADVADKSLNAMYSVTNAMNLYGTWIGLAVLSLLFTAIFAATLNMRGNS